MSEESRRIAEALGPDRDRRTREARVAVLAADALLAELDRRRDAELEEARDG